MNFFEAMVALQMGASVRSVHGEQFSVKDGVIVDRYGDAFGFELDADEVNASWEVAEPEHDFAWALETLIGGTKVCRSSWPAGVHFNVSDTDGRLLFNAQPMRPLSPEMMEEWLEANDWVRA